MHLIFHMYIISNNKEMEQIEKKAPIAQSPILICHIHTVGLMLQLSLRDSFFSLSLLFGHV